MSECPTRSPPDIGDRPGEAGLSPMSSGSRLNLFSATWFRCKPRRPIRQIFDAHGTSGQNAQGQFCKIAGLRKIRLNDEFAQ